MFIVHPMFIACSWFGDDLLIISSQLVHEVLFFMTCWWLVLIFSHIVHDCYQLVHNLFKMCWLVLVKTFFWYFFMIPPWLSQLIHSLFLTCSWFAHPLTKSDELLYLLHLTCFTLLALIYFMWTTSIKTVLPELLWPSSHFTRNDLYLQSS